MKHIFLIIFSFFILQKTIHAQADACFSVSEMLVTIESGCDASQTLVLTDTIYNNLDNYGAGAAATDTDGDGIPDTGDDTFSNHCFFGVYPESITYFHVVGDGNTYNIDTSIDCVPAGDTPLEITLMAVYEMGCDGTPILCGVGNYEDPLFDIPAFETVAGTDYYLAIADVGTDFGIPTEGDFCLVFDMVEVLGCTDPMADNYNPNANTDDGSCLGNINNICETAIFLPLVDMTYGGLSNIGNGQGNDIGSLSCVGLTSALNNVAYYQFVGDGNAYLINTNIDCVSNGNGIDLTYLRIFEGGCTNQIACGLGGEDTGFPMATLPALYTVPGVTYYIAVSDLGIFYNINEGDFCLDFDQIIEGCTDSNANNYNPNADIDDGTCIYPPENDECVGAFPIMLSSAGPFTNINATVSETTMPTGCYFGDDPYQASVYYTFVGDGFPYTFTTSTGCVTSGTPLEDTQIALFEGDCQNMIACNDDIDEAAGEWLSTLTFMTQANVEYYLLVDGWGGLQGDFCLDIQQEIMACTDSTALNFNADALFEDGSCQYEPVCNSSARFSNDNTRLIARNFTTFADDAFIRNFLTAERTYIRYQYEIHRILESDDAKYQQVNTDFDAIKEVALSTLFQSLISKQSIQVTDEHLQLIDRFLTNLSNATNKGKLKQEITEARRYLSVMKGKEIKDALIAYDRASSGGLSDITPPSNGQLQDDFEANIRHTIGRNSQLMMVLPTDGKVRINIHNTNGQLMQSYPETLYNKGEHITDLDKSGLTSGMYFIHINYVDDTGKSIQKTLKMPVLY